MSDEKCLCEGGPTLIFPCSGAPDVGEIADRAGRKLTRYGVGSMYCLAGIGGEVSGIGATTKAAGCIIVIDGCQLECARKTLAKAGISDIRHVRVTDLGPVKGQAPVTDETVAKVVNAVRQNISSPKL